MLKAADLSSAGENGITPAMLNEHVAKIHAPHIQIFGD